MGSRNLLWLGVRDSSLGEKPQMNWTNDDMLCRGNADTGKMKRLLFTPSAVSIIALLALTMHLSQSKALAQSLSFPGIETYNCTILVDESQEFFPAISANNPSSLDRTHSWDENKTFLGPSRN